MKKLISIFIVLSLLLVGCKSNSLPKPEVETGIRGELGVDKNINETTVDNYLNREDIVYRDMRMLKDEADYEAIGGDSYLSGYIEGFEIVPYPYICNPEGLPEDVGGGYKGNALFTKNGAEYIPNFEESLSIIENLFPKDKIIFLMCGGGGYAGMMKELLISLGYDQNKIYNVGGYWYYEGEHKIDVKLEENDKVIYDFENIPYHNIDFDTLIPINGYTLKDDVKDDDNKDVISSKMINISSLAELESMQNDKKDFLVYVYLPGCVSCAKFKPIVEDLIILNDIDVYQLNYQLLKKSENIIKQSIKWTPSLFIFEDGEVKAYLNPQKEEDKEIYKDTENLSKWLSDYIEINIVKTNSHNDEYECEETSCKL